MIANKDAIDKSPLQSSVLKKCKLSAHICYNWAIYGRKTYLIIKLQEHFIKTLVGAYLYGYFTRSLLEVNWLKVSDATNKNFSTRSCKVCMMWYVWRVTWMLLVKICIVCFWIYISLKLYYNRVFKDICFIWKLHAPLALLE